VYNNNNNNNNNKTSDVIFRFVCNNARQESSKFYGDLQAAWNLPSTTASTVTVVQICIPLVILLRCSLVLWMQCTLLPAPELLPCKEARGSQEEYSDRCVRIYLEL